VITTHDAELELGIAPPPLEVQPGVLNFGIPIPHIPGRW
jgi:hypothetical protein